MEFEKLNKVKKQLPREGDLFAIDLLHISDHAYRSSNESFKDKKGKYAFGRIIDIDPSTGAMIEIFNYTGDFIDNPGSIIAKGRMFDPLTVTTLSFNEGRWKIIGSDEKFDKQKAGFAKIKLVMGLAPRLKLWEGGKITPISEEDAKGLERYVTYFPENIEERILEVQNLEH